MGKPLRALLVEDEEDDAVLLLRELSAGGFDVTFERVDTWETMVTALDERTWDIVISDYGMPRFGALAALEIVKERKLDLPFIIVSGTVGEETAVDAIRAGAQDFIAKGKFARLIPAIERELRDTALRAERTKMQEQLLISDRMASVGTLAAGVAHEINNPLAALMMNLEFATQDLAELARELSTRGRDEDATADSHAGLGWVASKLRSIEDPLLDARECADRVRHIVRDLKIFSRSDTERTGAVDVRHVMESSLRMAWNEIRHRARLIKEYGDVPLVQANEARLGQVFLNLVINAAQAIPEGRASRNELRIITKQTERGWVVVEVRDTGSGIPGELLDRIFDPFFTTKPVGVGTGLGLAICHRIVTALGGELEVESEVGRGSVFRATLPVATRDAVTEAPPPAAFPAGRRGKILLVDDQPSLGVAIVRMLSSEHDVHAVTRARDALERIAAGERFDVILCDLMMPEMTGMDLHAELVLRAPAQAEKVVFMTGGAFTSRAREFLDEVRSPRVEKPFDMANLRALIRGLVR